MKANFLVLSILSLAIVGNVNNGYSQTIDYDKVILPASAGRNIAFAEKLVQLAWRNHPENKIAMHETELTALDQKISNKGWLDLVDFVGNINEFNIDPSRDVAGRADFFPRYNVGVRFSVGALFTIPLETKKADIENFISTERVNTQKLKIRQDVLVSYNNFLMFEKIYKIEETALQDTELSHQLIEEGFKRGDESYEKYMSSLSNFNRMQVNSIRSKTDYFNAKVDLESLIGVSLEDVF